VVERGGEFIDNAHKTMIGYAQRFGLALEDVTKGHDDVVAGRWERRFAVSRGNLTIEARILWPLGRVALCVLAISLSVTPGLAAGDSAEAWTALVRGGHVALIRHGNAPPGYGGDPPGFKIDDCTTQRNLDEQGRGEARALGEAFRHHGVRVDRIVSSPWCRCLETARLMAVGPVESSWALVPDRDPRSPVRLLELKEMVSAWRGPGTLVLVTHALTVRALLGFLPLQGETVVLKPGSGSAAGGDLVGLIAAPE